MRAESVFAGVCALIIAIATGALVAFADPGTLVQYTLAVVLSLSLLAALISGRRAVRRVGNRESRSDAEEEVSESLAGRAARGLFYLAALTIAVQVARFKGFALSDYLFAAAFVLALADCLSGRRSFPRFPSWIIIGAVLFAIGAFASGLRNSGNANLSYANATQFVLVAVGWLMLGALVLRTRKQLERGMSLWVASVALCAAWAIGQKLGAAPVFTDDATGRLGGLSLHPNALGAMAAVVMLPTLVLMLDARSAVSRSWLAVAFILIVAGLGISGSISGAAAAIASLLVGLIAQRTTVAVAIALLAAVAIGGYAVHSGNAETTQIGRFSVATSQNAAYGQGSLSSRVDVYDQAWTTIKEHPVIGRGLDPDSAAIYTSTTGREHLVHNLFLGTWYESGLLGLMGVLLIIGAICLESWRNVIRAASAQAQLLSIGLLGGVVGMVAVSMAEPIRDQRFVLVPACFAIAMYALRVAPARAERAVPGAAGERQQIAASSGARAVKIG